MPKAKVNEININYKVEGQGEPLIMIAGITLQRWSFLFQTHAFKKFYKVITFDNRGVGKTDKPDGPYTTRMMADDTISLMDYLKIDKAHVLGISMGGMIAQELAINYPDRVNKLVLGSTYANVEVANDESGISPELLKILESAGISNTSNRKALSTLSLCSFNNNKLLWRMLSPLISWSYFIRNGTKGFMGQLEAGHAHDTVDRLNMIKAQTLVITGTTDRVILPSSSEMIASRIPNAKLVKVENGSHVIFIETKGRFNQEVLDFLKSS